MKSAATKQKVQVPSLEERVAALREELEEALDALAAERRAAAAKGGPEGAVPPPLGTFRRMIDARGYGDCLCRSYLVALKEDQ